MEEKRRLSRVKSCREEKLDNEEYDDIDEEMLSDSDESVDEMDTKLTDEMDEDGYTEDKEKKVWSRHT